MRNTKYYELREDPSRSRSCLGAQDERLRRPDHVSWCGSPARRAGHRGDAQERRSPRSIQRHRAEFQILSTQIGDSLMRDRLMAVLAGSFGVLAGLLATIGLYGVIAYMVARRHNEIGVRIALGAGGGSVIGLVLREAVACSPRASSSGPASPCGRPRRRDALRPQAERRADVCCGRGAVGRNRAGGGLHTSAARGATGSDGSITHRVGKTGYPIGSNESCAQTVTILRTS